MSTYYRLLTVKEGHERGLSEDIDALSAEKAKRKQILDATISYEDGARYPEIVATDGWGISAERNGDGESSWSEEFLDFEFRYDEALIRPKQFLLEVDAAEWDGVRFMHSSSHDVRLSWESIGYHLKITSVKLWEAEHVAKASFWTNFRKCKEIDA